MRVLFVLLAVATLAASCDQAAGPASRVAVAASSMVIEKYGGLNDQPPMGLQRIVQVHDPLVIGRVQRELADLRPFPSDAMGCPFDDGSFFQIRLEFVSAAPVVYKVEARGCQGVYMEPSQQPAWWAIDSPLLGDLNALTGG
jgi:hypothetical protein